MHIALARYRNADISRSASRAVSAEQGSAPRPVGNGLAHSVCTGLLRSLDTGKKASVHFERRLLRFVYQVKLEIMLMGQVRISPTRRALL